MEWSSNVVRSLEWDPRHHEEVRNGPKIRFIYGKSFPGVRKKSGVLTGASRRFWRTGIVRNIMEGSGNVRDDPGCLRKSGGFHNMCNHIALNENKSFLNAISELAKEFEKE
jgi:hypothetical protein